MSTYMQKNETVVRKWYVVDAADKPMGRTAVAVADLLRGKNDPTFTPNADCGNFVIVVNAEKAVLTGRKMEHIFIIRKMSSFWQSNLVELICHFILFINDF